MTHPEPPIYGLMAEFDEPRLLIEAARKAREQGFRRMEAYTPYPIEEVDEALQNPRNRLPLIVLCGGILGGISAYALQYYVAVIDFPINVGGRPLNSWPSFIVIVFELTVLFAACAAFFGLLALCGLPRPYHPVFNVKGFQLASRNRFFLCIESRDPLFDRATTAEFLGGLSPCEVSEVER